MYVGIVFFVDDALEFVVGECGCHRGGIRKCGSGYYAFGHFHTREHILLVALPYVECEFEFAFHHVGLVLIHDRYSHRAPVVVIYYRGVATHLFPLEGIGLGCHFLPVEAEVGGHCYLGVFHEEFCRYACCDGCGNAVAYYFQRVGVDSEIISLELIQFFAASRKHYGAGGSQQHEVFRVHDEYWVNP